LKKLGNFANDSKISKPVKGLISKITNTGSDIYKLRKYNQQKPDKFYIVEVKYLG